MLLGCYILWLQLGNPIPISQGIHFPPYPQKGKILIELTLLFVPCPTVTKGWKEQWFFVSGDWLAPNCEGPSVLVPIGFRTFSKFLTYELDQDQLSTTQSNFFLYS